MISPKLSELNAALPDLRERLENLITVEAMSSAMGALADTPAPSQTAAVTRGPVVGELLDSWAMAGCELTLDTDRTGMVKAVTGSSATRLVAHLDEISYLLAGRTDSYWNLAPFCYHLADGPRPARVIRLNSNQHWSVVAEGRVEEGPDGLRVDLDGDPDQLRPGDRVSLTTPYRREESGRFTGAIDNAAGVAAALLAARVLYALDVPFEVILPDEEEGPHGESSRTISRGATRALWDARPTDLDIVIDTHGLPPDASPKESNHHRSWGASITEYSSHARGAVTPPLLVQWIGGLAEEMATWDIVLRQNLGGYVPRSDDVISTLRSRQVAIVGYPGSNRHFDAGPPTANLYDLVHLARALAVIAASKELERTKA